MATTKHRTSRQNAGSAFFGGSFTLKCIVTAPSIKPAMTAAAGLVNIGNQIPNYVQKPRAMMI